MAQNGGWVIPQEESQGAITVNCVTGAPFTVSLSPGNNPQPHNAPQNGAGIRAMSSGSSLLTYDIVVPSGCTYTSCSGSSLSSCNDSVENRWGFPGAGSVNQGSLSFIGTGTTESIATCGYIWSNTPAPPAGTYSDTVVATLTF